jgi:glyceraldehyde 3-phosphate dehydrogenase
MSIRIAINGFGRIGRNTLKAALGRLSELEFVAVNDLTDTRTLAHLLKYDSTYGKYGKNVEFDESSLTVDGRRIVVTAEKDPTKLPWADLRVDVVLECTGRFVTRELAGQHLTAGAKRVIISAPTKGGDVPTYVLGVNDAAYDGAAVVSNASCTTNCIAPVAAVMHEGFGVAGAMMTTVHSYTADQNLQDGPHKDLRRARAAAENMVPTSTGAAIAVAETIPELGGRFDGISIRVPTPVVSVADYTFLLERDTTVEEVAEAFRAAARQPRWQGIMEVTDEPLVSSDFRQCPLSSVVDLPMLRVVGGRMVKVVAWYDNEWGYSNRLAELALKIGRAAAGN